MEPTVLRGRRWLVAGVAVLLVLIVATRLATVFLAVNGGDDLPEQIIADVIAAAVVLGVAFSGDRYVRWIGVILFATWGLFSLYITARTGDLVFFTLRGIRFLLSQSPLVPVLGGLNGVACLGFAVLLVASPSVKRYLATLHAPWGKRSVAPPAA